MESEIQPLEANLNDKDVSRLFEQNDWVSAPVVDSESRLIGRITIDDVVDVIMEDADQNFLGMAGVAEDTFAAPARAARSRILWLSINLMTAFIASMTISLFQATIDQIVYLAILMPIVASMGGVAGTQTLTIMIRGLTLQQINKSNLKWLYKKGISSINCKWNLVIHLGWRNNIFLVWRFNHCNAYLCCHGCKFNMFSDFWHFYSYNSSKAQPGSSNCRKRCCDNCHRCNRFLFFPWSCNFISYLTLSNLGSEIVPRISY
jgi:hypothetical protein